MQEISISVFDVAVGMRRSLPTFCKWVGGSYKNQCQFRVPVGFTHGFLVLWKRPISFTR